MVTNNVELPSQAKAERLTWLIEECGEVIQAACKILRFGYESDNQGKRAHDNRAHLSYEVGQLMYITYVMHELTDLQIDPIEEGFNTKYKRLLQYARHQPKEVLTMIETEGKILCNED